MQVCRYGLWTTHGSTLDQGTLSTDALAVVQRCVHGENLQCAVSVASVSREARFEGHSRCTQGRKPWGREKGQRGKRRERQAV